MPKKMIDKNLVSIRCPICEERIDKDNSFTWLVDGKIANIRFCSAKCMNDYCQESEDEERE